MPRFVVLDREGDTAVVELGRDQLDAKRGVLEALAADDGDNEIRLGDIGLGALSAAEFARAVHIALTPTPWDELESVLALRGSARGTALLEAVEWIGAESSARIATAARRIVEAPPGDDLIAQRVVGFDRARGTEMKVSLQSVFLAGPARALLGVLVGGSIMARAARGERLQWAVVQATYHGDVDALRYLWHLRAAEDLPVRFEDVLDCHGEDFRGVPEQAGRSSFPRSAFATAAFGGSLDGTQFLLSLRELHRGPIDPRFNYNEVFRAAAEGGHVEAMRFLLSLRETRGVAIDPTASSNESFRAAAARGHVEALQLLWSLRESHGVAIDPTAENNEAFRAAAANGHVDVLRFLWSLRESHGIDIDPAASENESFEAAADYGHVDVLRFLWSLYESHGVAIDPAVDKDESLRAAANRGHVDKLCFLWSLREKHSVVSDPTDFFPSAAAIGRVDVLSFFWSLRESHGVIIDPSAQCNMIFQSAAANGHVDVLRFLWSLWQSHGAPTDISSWAESAFHAAVNRGDVAMIRFLWSISDSDGVAALQARINQDFRTAAAGGHLEVLRFLWSLRESHGVAIDPTASGNEAFRTAAKRGDVDVLRFLWSLRESRGVAIDPCVQSDAPFRDAARHGHIDVLRFLWSRRELHGCPIDPTARENEAFRAAAAGGSMEVMRFLWFGVPIDPPAVNDEATRRATGDKYVEVLRFLLSLREEHGVAIDPSARGNEALRAAALGGLTTIMQLLWSLRESHGVTIDLTANDNECFRAAAAAGHADVLNFLWSLRESEGVGIDPTACGNEALLAASRGGHVDVLRFLLLLQESHGVAIDPTVRDCGPIHEALRRGDCETMRLVWSMRKPHHGAVEVLERECSKAFWEAARRGDVEALRFLWSLRGSHGVDIDPSRMRPVEERDHRVPMTDEIEESPLVVALSNSHVEAARFILDATLAAGLDPRDVVGSYRPFGGISGGSSITTVFEQAAGKGDVSVLALLWELHERHGVDVDPKGLKVARLQPGSRRGYVALTNAVWGYHRLVIKFLAQLHRDGKVVIDDRDLADALRLVEVSDRLDLYALLVPMAEDASAEASRLVEELSSDASVERRLAALDRLRALATAASTRESVAVVAEVAAALVAGTQAECLEVREASWLVVDELSASATLSQMLAYNHIFSAMLGRELDSASPAVRARGFRILSRVVRAKQRPELRGIRLGRLVELEDDEWGLRAIAGLLDESPEVQREAMIAAAELDGDLRDVPDEDQRRALGVLSHHISRGTPQERTAALVVLSRWSLPSGETIVFETEGLFRSLLEHSESMPRAVAHVFESILNCVDDRNRDTPLLTPSVLRDVEATLLTRLRDGASIDARLSAVEVLSVIARNRQSAELLVSIDSFIPLCVGVVKDSTLPVWCRARGARLLGVLAGDPSVRERLLRSPGLLRTLRDLIITDGVSEESRTDLMRAVEAMLVGENDNFRRRVPGLRPRILHNGIVCEPTAGSYVLQPDVLVEGVEVLLDCLGRPRVDSSWCVRVLVRLSRLDAHQAPMGRVPRLFAALVANLNEPGVPSALNHLARVPSSRVLLAETPGLQARVAEALLVARGGALNELVSLVFRLVSDPAIRGRVMTDRTLIDALICVTERQGRRPPAALSRGGALPPAADPTNLATETFWLLLDDNAALVELVRSRVSSSKLEELEGQWREAEASGLCASYRPPRNPRGWGTREKKEVVKTHRHCVCM